VSPCFSSKSSQKRAKNGRIFPTQKFEKTRFVIPKGHFVTPKGGFVMVAPEKGNCWFIFEAGKLKLITMHTKVEKLTKV